MHALNSLSSTCRKLTFMPFILYLFLFSVFYVVCSELQKEGGTWPPFIFICYTFLIDAFDSEVHLGAEDGDRKSEEAGNWVLISESFRVNSMEYCLVDSLCFSVIIYCRNNDSGL